MSFAPAQTPTYTLPLKPLNMTSFALRPTFAAAGDAMLVVVIPPSISVHIEHIEQTPPARAETVTASIHAIVQVTTKSATISTAFNVPRPALPCTVPNCSILAGRFQPVSSYRNTYSLTIRTCQWVSQSQFAFTKTNVETLASEPTTLSPPTQTTSYLLCSAKLRIAPEQRPMGIRESCAQRCLPTQ